MSTKKAASKKGGASKPKPSNGEDDPGLVRNRALGMNCQTILTGFYDARGGRIKHTVSKGAMQMPQESIDLIEDNSKGITVPSEYKLPGLEAVVRPMIDPKVEKVVVTELSSERVAVPQQPPPPPPGQMYTQLPQVTYVTVVRTRAQNRIINRALEAPTERIRGGGNEDGPTNMQVDGQPPASNSQPLNAASSAAAPTTAPLAPTRASLPSTAAPQIPANNTAATQPKLAQPAAAATNPGPARPAPMPSQATAQIRHPNPAGTAPTRTAVPTLGAVTNAQPRPAAPHSQPRPAVANAQPRHIPSNVQPAAVRSGAATTKMIPVRTLSSKPLAQWTQHKPGPNDETVTPEDQLSPKPDWYKKDTVVDIERTMLPEWFDSSAPHRTPEKYITTRNRIIAMSDTIKNRNVTNHMIRRSIGGDAGSLHRLRNFLVNWGFINEDGINDSAPTPAPLRHMRTIPLAFDAKLGDGLIEAVVQVSKRRKLDPNLINDVEKLPVDWEEVATQVGHGVTATDCERNFLSMQINVPPAAPSGGERPAVPAAPIPVASNNMAPPVAGQQPKVDPSRESIRQELIESLIDSSNKEVVKKVTAAALDASPSNMKEAQSASLLGLVASRAVEQARSHENALSAVLSQLVNRKMEKLENRMAMIDDVEGILEAERVALELERRDLYTARCRHWYGGA